MKNLTGLPKQLEVFLHHHQAWASKGYLTADIQWKHQIGKHAGVRYLPETVGRALRTLEEKSVIAVKDEGISVQYAWIPPEKRKFYIPFSTRPDYLKHKMWSDIPV